MTPIELFMARFSYKPDLAGRVGVECERFITDQQGILVPRAFEVLEMARRLDPEHKDRYVHELSACQAEVTSDACSIDRIVNDIRQRERVIAQTLEVLGLRQAFVPVAPDDMPLDIYPDARYTEIAGGMSEDQRRRACRVAAVHVHVGMPDPYTALCVYNEVIKHTDRLCALGDRSNGERLRIYRKMNLGCMPQPFESWAHFFEIAREGGFAEDPKKCWTLIRISIHGTIEFRMFDTTASLEDILMWVQACHDICHKVLAFRNALRIQNGCSPLGDNGAYAYK